MESIFKGPSFYEEKDQSIFLGRKKETEDLLYLVEHSDFCVCYAESGEGKSSLINAGLQPLMRDNKLFPVRIVFNDQDYEKIPIGCSHECEDGAENIIDFDMFIWDKIEQAISFAQHTELYNGKYQTLTIQRSQIIDDYELRDKLWWRLRNNELRLNSYDAIMPVLIFDQFEEVFNRAKDINWTYAFFKWLEELYQDDIYDGMRIKGCKTKKFKVLLSLRSDYVSELDYWCMTKFFIPSLKNNRYCLKPLTKKSAYEVVELLQRLPDGIEYDDIIKSAKTERSGNWNYVAHDLPCVSALILSLVLTGLDKQDEDIKRKLDELKSLGNEEIGEEFFQFVINHIYEKALIRCGIGRNSSLRQILEESLVDTNGRRRIVPRLDHNLQKIPESILNLLAAERIIIISGMNVEIAHDCLRKVVENHNLERQKELEKEKRRNAILRKAAERAGKRLVRQKYNIYAFLLLLVSFTVSYTFLRFHSYSNIVPAFLGKANLLQAWIDIIGTIAIAIVPTILTFLFYMKKCGKTHVNNITSMFFFFLFLYSACVMYDLEFCPIEGYISTCDDSAWALPVVLISFFAINQSKPLGHYLVYSILIIPLFINAYGKIQAPFEVFIAYLGLVSLFILYSFYNCRARIYNRCLRCVSKTFWSAANLAVLFATVFFQIGFNILRIDYNSVQRDNHLSIPWQTMVVRNNGKSGLLDARFLYGNAIIPCVFDSIYYIPGTDIFSFFYMPNNTEVEAENYGTFSISRENYTDRMKVSMHIHPLYEIAIKKIMDTESFPNGQKDSVKYIASHLYKELKTEIIGCLQKNTHPNIDNLPSFERLDSIHKKQTGQLLSDIKERVDSARLTDLHINMLYRAIYSDLCLCVMKDRIINEDVVGVLHLFDIIQVCEFQEEYNRYHNASISYTIDGNNYINFSTKSLSDNSSVAYSNMLHLIAGIDMKPHAEIIIEKLKDDNSQLNDLLVSVLNEINVINIFEVLKSISMKVSKGMSFDVAKKKTIQQMIGGAINQIGRFDDLDQLFMYNYLESEVSYKILADTTLLVLLPIIESGKSINYNSSFVDICRELTKVSVCRWNEDGDNYAMRLKKADDRRQEESYKLIEDIVEAVNNNKESLIIVKQKVKEITNNLTDKIKQELLNFR